MREGVNEISQLTLYFIQFHPSMLGPYFTHKALSGDQELGGGPHNAVGPKNLALSPAGV